MSSFIFPSVQNVQEYARALNSNPNAPLMQYGAPMSSPLAGSVKPRLKLTNSGQVLIVGADNGTAFMPPMQPLQPFAQAPEYQVVGRQWDYPVGYNTRVTPRDGLGIGFGTLKALADGYDVLRLMIERVKDKIVTKPWSIQNKDKKKQKDSRCEFIEDFFHAPDGVHTWTDWSRMLLEEVIVYDAPALYLRRTYGGKPFSLEVMDGRMFAPKVMADGRLPPPDVGPAYQQVIKSGLPVVDYIMPVMYGQPIPRDPDGNQFPELFYKPRNPRANSVYGFGPVEQMITTVSIAIARESYLAQFYSAGSTPDLIFKTPKEWTTQQIREFKVWWDSVLAGNLANRRGTMFVPDGTDPVNTKENALTDQTDEWLVRIMCFCLGLNPMPFLKQMNKGQEKTHHDEAASEGLQPWQHWFVDLFSVIIPRLWGWNDLEFRWEEEDATDPLEQAQIDQILVGAKIYHPDELRAKRGDDAMPPDMRDEMDMATFSAAANSTILPDDQQAAKDKAAETLAAAKPAPVVAQSPQTAAEKFDIHNHIKVDAPAITIEQPAITVDAPTTIAKDAIHVTLPPITQGDTFVDVGATSVKVEAPAQAIQAQRKFDKREVAVGRNANGEMVGTITESVTRTVHGRVDEDGKMIAKVDQ